MYKLWPVVGMQYVITEWDGSQFKVNVTETSAETNSVTFEYTDTKLKHKVEPDYFAFELMAFGTKRAA